MGPASTTLWSEAAEAVARARSSVRNSRRWHAILFVDRNGWEPDVASEHGQRKIAAILVADVVGYSRLAGADEDRTLARLQGLRSDLIDPAIAVHHGRIVKRTGDGSLIEFRSVVDAVRCAIEVQNGLIERNAGVPPERRIEFRVGIHLGDVVEENDGDLMGDGVNIAARLESVCEPGAICLSEDAYRQVKQRRVMRNGGVLLPRLPVSGFFRPHFFVNTPDINPDFLQNAPRPAFLIRATLAATLSGLWGIYNGFELCEGKPDPQRKEYLNSEKYEIRAWDWNCPGNIIGEITALNRIRRENPALHSHLGLSFHNAWNENVMFFEKATVDRENVVLVAVSLDPGTAQEADIEIPLWKFGLTDYDTLRAEDQMRGHQVVWTGKHQCVRLDPELPFAIWRVG